MLREMTKLLRVTGGALKFIILLILRSPVDLCMAAIQAVFLQNAFDAIEQNDAGRLTVVCVAFIVASLCIFLYNGTVWSMYAPFVVRMESKLRVKLFDKISHFSYERMEATTQGEWLTRLNTDVQMPFSQPIHLPHAVNAILRISVSAIVLWKINPAVFGWVMLFVIPHIIVSQFLVARAMPELNEKALEATAKNTGELTALITCADVAWLYNGQDYLMNRFKKSSLALLHAKMRIHKRNALSAAMMPLFGLGGYLALLIASGTWISDGVLTFGDLTAAFQYRGGVLTGSMMLINCVISIQASMAGIRRINETMAEETEGTNGRGLDANRRGRRIL